MNELRPKLFDVMKSYTKEQLMKDIVKEYDEIKKSFETRTRVVNRERQRLYSN